MSVPALLFTSLSAKKALFQAVLEDARRFHPEASLLGTDCNPSCPAASTVENFVTMPQLSELDSRSFHAFCVKEGITHIIPTRDGELTFLSQACETLARSRIKVFLPSGKALSNCLDKLLFFRQLTALEIPVILTGTDLEEIEGERFVVKERHGAGSAKIGLNLNHKQALEHARKLKFPIFQPYVRGREFSSEIWLDRNSRALGVVLRWRSHIIDGESHGTETFRNPAWEDFVIRTSESLGLTGHVLGQVLVDDLDSLQFVEINPRLGGASPLSLACGLHSIEWFLRECAGEDLSSLPIFRAPEGKRLTRRNDVVQIDL